MIKKKILFFTENLYGGGVEKISQIILSHFDYNRYDVVLYSLCKNEFDPNTFSPHIKYKYIYDKLESQDSVISRFIKLAKNKIKLLVYAHTSSHFFYKLFVNEKVDVAIAFIEGYATRIISGAPNTIKKIGWAHIELDNYHWTKIAFKNNEEECQCYKSLDIVPCVSQNVKEQVDKIFGLAKTSRVVYNPIDSFQIQKEAIKEDILYQNEKINIVAVGSLTPRKGFDRLLQVAKKLKTEGFDINVTILGKGTEQENLLKIISDNDMSSYIKLVGFQQNPYPYLKQADMYVCSSYAEGFNTAITEALVLGKPVVSTECSGVKEQLGNNNEWGICCKNSEEGLYAGIKKMLTNNNIIHYAKQAAIRGKDFSLETSMNAIYKIIEE